MNIISNFKKWRWQLSLRLSFPLFRNGKYLYAALLQQSIAGIVALIALIYTIIHYSDAPSLVVRYGKPLIVIIGMGTLAVNAYFQNLRYIRNAERHRRTREFRQANNRRIQELRQLQKHTEN